MEGLEGVIIPVVTCFDQDQQLDVAAIGANIAAWNRSNVCGYMLLGTNGEFRSISDEEALRVVSYVDDHRAGDKTLVVGVGRESLVLTKAFIKKLREAEVDPDYISVFPPHYFHKLMNHDALRDYYLAVAEYSPWPVLLYCVPKNTNNLHLFPDLVAELAGHPNICGIKDSSADMMEEYFQLLGGRDDFKIIAGSINNLDTCILHGGECGVISAANYFPDLCQDVFTLFLMYDRYRWSSYVANLKELVASTGGKSGIAGVKCAMDIMGFQGGPPRLPVRPLSEGERMRMETIMRNSDLLKKHFYGIGAI